MTVHPLPPHVQAFFTDRLTRQLGASANTLASYRDTFRLLLKFASGRLGRAPTDLAVADINAAMVGHFLDHLETGRNNSIRSRNARLTAIRSFFADVARNEPELLHHCQQVLAMPHKRHEKRMVEYLDEKEIMALLAAPDLSTGQGRRDRALLLLAVQTGLRVSELTGLKCGDIAVNFPAHVQCRGKGRRQRTTPLRPDTIKVLNAWLEERAADDDQPLFASNRNGSLSRDAVEQLVRKHAVRASQSCPSLKGKRVSPHCLRHTAAMELLRRGVSITVIALWHGHASVETTLKYLHADMTIKEKAMERTRPFDVPKGRYHPSDELIRFLDGM